MPAYPYNPYFMNRGADPDQDQVALFIDWDNLVISNYADRGANRPNIEVIVQKAQQYGTVVIARAYAEWTVMIDRLEVYKAGVEPIYAPVFHSERDLSGQMGKGKSLADPVMVTDCIDFLHLLPQVGTYVLVTGDKDMMPVVRLAKLRGRRVVVIGPDYVANVLQQICDEFVPYRLLLATAQPTDPYAATYYQQPGYYPPQVPQGYYPPQMQQPQQPSTDTRGRGGRRLPGRRTSNAQPYKDVTPPPVPQVAAPQPPYPNYYYAPPQQGVPQTPDQAYQGYPTTAYPQQGQPPYQGYPTQQPTQSQAYTPGYGAPEMTAPTGAIPTGYSQPPVSPAPVTQGQQAGYPVPTPQQVVPAPVAAQPTRPTLVTPAPAPQPAPEREKSSAASNFEDVKDTIRSILGSRAVNGRGQMRARDLKEELLRRIPNFNERRYGYSKFKALLNAVEQAGILQMDQSGHILWVSLPGTPKTEAPSEFDEATLDAAIPANGDEFEDEEEEEEEEETETAIEELDAAVAVAEPQLLEETPIPFPAQEMVETEVPEEGAVQLPEVEERYVPTPTAEERVTTLADAPIGAHRADSNKERERRPQPELPKPGKALERIPGLGARPALLEQAYYQDVIVTIEALRHRNRWLGYELLLSSVRDYLTKHLPESEAKSQAGAILSKLLNEGVLKMGMEVHSRGPRKMRVQVAHLQEEHPAVRYAMAAKARAAAETEQTSTASPEMEAATVPAEENQASVEQAQPGNEFSSPDAQTFEAVAEVVAEQSEVVLAVDEGGVPVIEAEGQPSPEEGQGQPEMLAVSPETGEASAPEAEQFQAENQPTVPTVEGMPLQFGDQTQMEGETGQLPQEPEMSVQTQPTEETSAQGEEGQPQVQWGQGDEGQPQTAVEAQAQTVEEAPAVEAGAEAGDLGHESHAPQMEEGYNPEHHHEEQHHEHQPAYSAPEQHYEHHEHQGQHEAAPEYHTPEQQHEQDQEQHDYHAPEQQHEQHDYQAVEQHHEHQPAYSAPEQHHEHQEHTPENADVTGEAVTAQVVETPGTEGETGEHVQGEPEHAPQGEDPAPAGGFINTVELDPNQASSDGNHQGDGAASGEEEVEGDPEPEASTEEVAVPHQPRRRRTPRPVQTATEGGSESMAQPREPRRATRGCPPPRNPRTPTAKHRPFNAEFR